MDERTLYGGKDPRNVPAYTPREAAQFLDVPESTVRAWCFGQADPVRGTRFRRVIRAAAPKERLLSFSNLVELFVLASLRRRHRVNLSDVRRLIDVIRKETRSDSPLADSTLASDEAGRLFVEWAGRVFNVSNEWQQEMVPVVRQYLRRVERDEHGVPVRLYPFTTRNVDDERRTVVIDPRVAFGRPCIVGTSVPVVSLIERFEAGDRIVDLAEDFGLRTDVVEEAVRFDRRAA